MPLLDTNIIVRYLSRDDPERAARSLAYFERLETGSVKVTLTEAVLVETIQVLTSKRLYAMRRDVVRERLATIIRLRGVHMLNKRLYLQALDLYVAQTGLSFVDALLARRAQSESVAIVVSFDRGFDRVAGVQRIEP